MAELFEDDQTPLNAANLNKTLAGDAVTTYQLASWGLRIRYNGSSWEAVASTGATDQIVNVALAWDGTNERISIDIVGCDNPFTTTPVAVVSPYTAGTQSDELIYNVKVQCEDARYTYVQFFVEGDTTPVASQSSNMDFYIIWNGRIS